MGFFYGLIAILFIIFLLAYTRIKKPLFGNALITITLLLISLSTFFYFQMDKRIEKKQQLIPVEEISLTDVNSSLAYGNNYKLAAKIKNHSKRYRLQSVNLQIEFLKCQSAQQQLGKCLLLKKGQYKIKTRLAASQSSNIEKYIMLDDLGVFNKNDILRWKVEVLSGVAR
ncbi:MAG: hypothetical protein KZQ83_16380 [gamma proteobacterium symbiont of Taylorina sp.]|nr:hypothetical protein [gamma proteobacterium symbiont of Taylorina sp.]